MYAGPHLLFSPETGEPTHLTSGVCLNSNYTLCNDNPAPGYYDYTFTSVQPVNTKTDDEAMLTIGVDESAFLVAGAGIFAEPESECLVSRQQRN